MEKRVKKEEVTPKTTKSSDTITFTVPHLSNIRQWTTPVLVILLIVAAFFLGMLYNKVQSLEKEKQAGTLGATTTTTATQQGQPAQPTPVTVTKDQIKALFTDKNLTFGDKNSKNLLVEVADPSCPYCHAAAGHNPELNKQMGSQFQLDSDGGTYAAPVPKMKELVDEGKAAFVYIYTPGHGNGEMGMKALYCANEQGKFWEAHNKLMTNAGYELMNTTVKNDKTKSQEIVDFLSDVVDSSTLKSCIDSGKYDSKLTQDVSTASSLGVQGTPGFFVNTTRFAGAYSWKDMQSAVK